MQTPLADKLVFPKDVEELLSFGFLGLPSQAFLGEHVQGVRGFARDKAAYRVIYLPEALNEAYRRILLMDELRDMKRAREDLLERIENYPSRMSRLFDGLMQLIEQTVPGASVADRLRTVYTDWYAQLEPYVRMEKQVKEGGLAQREERVRYIEFKDKHRRLLEEAEEMLRGYASADNIRSIAEAMQVETETVATSDKRLAEATREFDRKTNEAREITAVTVRVALEEEIAYFQSMARMCAKWAKVPPQSIPLAKREVAGPKGIVQTLAQIEEFDPGLFNNRVAKKRGAPTVLVLPASGNGKYDWKNNRFLIPMLCPRSILESLASAAINYRDDVDRQSGDREMLNSFKDTKEVRDIRSTIKIQDKLMAEYVAWIVKESAGFQVMEKETREWFEEHIAPDKNDVRIPKEYRFLTIKDINAEIARLKDQPDAGDKFYRLAVLVSMKNKRDQDDQRESLRYAELAVEKTPTSPDYIYTLGILCKRTHKKKEAADAFRRYTQIAPQSWWSRKAQEHLVGF